MTIPSISLFILFISAIFLGYHVLELEASHRIFARYQTHPKILHKSPVKQAYRTGYHFQPPKNWINDPNGPMVYKGIYHLFYQYNPKGAVWGNIVWAHSTSTDLVNWIPHKPAIFPSQQADIKGCWSGSATILPGGKPVILYTGIDPKESQVQNLAMPKNISDPYLTEWVKNPKNPLIQATPMNKINGSAFRDPTTAWLGPDKLWRVLVGSRNNQLGVAYLFKSKDFDHWTLAEKPFHSAEGTGMWECPDFFPVRMDGGQKGLDTSSRGDKVKYVLKNSLDETKHDYYTIGTYDAFQDKYVPDKGMVEGDAGLRYDYGKFYASKTFFDDEKQRRILWGWTNESSSLEDDVRKGWSGVQAIPRSVWLDKSGKQLLQWPVKEIEKLRGKQVQWPSKILKAGSKVEVNGITAGQADIEVSFQVSDLKSAEVLTEKQYNPQLLCSKSSASVKGGLGPFGFLTFASSSLREYTAVFFRIYKHQNKHKVLMCSDQSRSSLNKHNDKTSYGAFLDLDPAREQLSLRSLIDHSIVESFGGGGKVVISSRVYPTLAIDNQVKLFVFNNGTSNVKINNLNAWSMKRARIG